MADTGGKTAQLSIDGKTFDLPVLGGTIGPDVIDVGKLTANGYFTYDPGFVSTASCDSGLTYIDGDAGILLHRGYPIEQLAEQSDHLEVCYLLLNGELPNAAQKQAFVTSIKQHAAVDSHVAQFFKGFQQNAHPMAMMCAVTGALAALYNDSIDIDNAADRQITAHRLIAKMPNIAAMSYKHGRGEAFVQPRDDLDYGANFLNMLFGTPAGDYQVNPVIAKAMDRIFLLHADHEQNASTSTVRLAGSTGTNPIAAIAAGIAALWGPAHGGANEAVLTMLNEIGDEKHIDKFIAKAKDKDDPFRIMGFGHRVYKNYDPRAKVMQQTCKEVLSELGTEDDPILRIAQRLEKIALEDEYFVEKRLYPNVDFYSGIILKAIGIPTELFTGIFVTGRTPGWIAQWNEMVGSPYKIGRPRQRYIGPARRDYVPVGKR